MTRDIYYDDRSEGAREARSRALALIAAREGGTGDKLYGAQLRGEVVWCLEPNDPAEVRLRLIGLLDALTLFALVGVASIERELDAEDLAAVLRWLEKAADELAEG